MVLERYLSCLPHEDELVRVRNPLTAPAASGEKDTEKLAVRRGEIEIGSVGPANLNPVPETVAVEMVIVTLSELVTATGMIRLLPACTLPKLRVEVENAI
jgi:hypothetical protein